MSQETEKKDPADVAELKLPLWKANCWFAVLWIIFMLDFADRNCMAVALPAIKKAFDLTDAQAGLVGSAFGFTLALTSFPISLLIDRWSRRKMVTIMVGFWSVATWATGFAKGFITLLIPRLMLGVGEAAYNSAGYALLSAWYPKSKRGRIFGIYNTAVTLGSALGVSIGGYIAYHYGWRIMFGVLAVPGLIFAAIAWFMPDYKTKKVEEQTEQEVKPKFVETMKYILTTPALLFVYLGTAMCMMALSAFGIWSPTYLVRTYDLNLAEAGKIMGMIGLIAWPGAIIGGWIGDWLLKRTPKGRPYAVCITVALLAVVATLALNTAHYTIFLVFWTLTQCLLIGYNSNSIACTQELVPPYFRGISFSFIPLFNQLLAGVWAPMVVGALSDIYGLGIALQVIAIASPVFAILFFGLASIYYQKGLDKLRRMGTFSLETA